MCLWEAGRCVNVSSIICVGPYVSVRLCVSCCFSPLAFTSTERSGRMASRCDDSILFRQYAPTISQHPVESLPWRSQAEAKERTHAARVTNTKPIIADLCTWSKPPLRWSTHWKISFISKKNHFLACNSLPAIRSVSGNKHCECCGVHVFPVSTLTCWEAEEKKRAGFFLYKDLLMYIMCSQLWTDTDVWTVSFWSWKPAEKKDKFKHKRRLSFSWVWLDVSQGWNLDVYVWWFTATSYYSGCAKNVIIIIPRKSLCILPFHQLLHHTPVWCVCGCLEKC